MIEELALARARKISTDLKRASMHITAGRAAIGRTLLRQAIRELDDSIAEAARFLSRKQ